MEKKEFVSIVALFAISIIFIAWFVIKKWLQAYFVIEINKDKTIMTVHKSWFFQKELVFKVGAEKITIRSLKMISVSGMVDDLSDFSKLGANDRRYFKIDYLNSYNIVVNITHHADCRFISPL